jgi:hypothetical protein
MGQGGIEMIKWVETQQSKAMGHLTPQQLHERLSLDYRVVMKMRCPIMTVEAYRNADDLAIRSNLILSEDESHLATHYRIDYSIKTLVGPDRFSQRTSVKIDLLGNNNYPYSAPLCWVISSEIPWSPHFRQGFPICISHELWTATPGRLLLGSLLVHIAKLLNFDELPYDGNYEYGGYTPEAAAYWRTKLNRQPITPTLMYPVLPLGFATPDVGSFVNRILGVRQKNKSKRPLRVFLCHSSSDKQVVRKLYSRLCGNGIDAWLDEEKLLPGQKWELEIPKAVRNSDIVVVCLSKNAINQSGYLQKEILYALEVANEKPEDTIFLVPFKLEPCEIPMRLQHLHCAGLHEEQGYERLMCALRTCADKID